MMFRRSNTREKNSNRFRTNLPKEYTSRRHSRGSQGPRLNPMPIMNIILPTRAEKRYMMPIIRSLMMKSD